MSRRSDRRPLYVQVTGTGFTPDRAPDWEMHRKFKPGTILEGQFHEPRNKDLNAKMWKTFDLIVKATDAWPSSQAMATELKLRLRCVDEIQLWGGGSQIVPKSFRDMDKEEFESFWENATLWIASNLGIDVNQMLDDARAEL
jgi:hypothetical protein